MTTMDVNADAQVCNNAVVDSNGITLLVNALSTKLPDVCLTCTSSTLKHAIASAELKLNASAEQLQSTPLADVQPAQLAQLLRSMTQLPVNADAHQSLHVVVDSSGTVNHVHVLLTPMPDVSPHSMPMTPMFAIADAEPKLNALAEQQLSTPLADALLSKPVSLLKSSTHRLANALAQVSKHAVVDSSGTASLAHAQPTQLQDVCLTFTDSTTPLVTAFV